MKSTRRRGHSAGNKRTQLLCLVVFTPLSLAQVLTSSTSTPSIQSFIAPVSEGPQPSEPVSSATNTLPTFTVAHRTTPSAMSTSTTYTSDIFSDTHSSDDRDEDEVTVFNYYFLFLAAIGMLIALLLWWLHRRRRERKAEMRRSGQHALARDLEGWAGTRRSTHSNIGRYHAAHVRRQDGLDEYGEAPPPYQPKNDTAVALTPVEGAHDTDTSLAVPLRALPRDDVVRGQPPEYSANTDTHSTASMTRNSTRP